jgi:hypothetical protein
MIISMIILMIVETWHGLRMNLITNKVSSDFFISPDHDSSGISFKHDKSWSHLISRSA